jgi:hemerythrin superfamily protein
MPHTRIRAVPATTILRDDHRRVQELLAEYEKIEDAGAADSKLELFLELRKELTIHAEIEEKVFYPAIESLKGQDPRAGARVRQALEEHEAVAVLLDELTDLQPEDDEFDAKVMELAERVTHHAEEEEEEMFPLFERLPKERQAEISEELRFRKVELTEAYDEE